ncbi:MAG: adenylate/guanylate cyclase domain-containing protein [Verrucomicrobiales bacterium]
MTDQTTHRIAVLLFTDLVDSVGLQGRLGTNQYAEILRRHDELFRSLIAGTQGRILKHTGDGFLAEFSVASEAVTVALAFQLLLHREQWGVDGVAVRVGLHQGEVIAVEDLTDGEGNLASPLAVGMAVNIAARIMDMAAGGQILMSQAVYENARHYVRQHPPVAGLGSNELPELEWRNQGEYLLQGAPEPVGIFQVGADGIAPMDAPGETRKARRLPEGQGSSRVTTRELPVEEIDSSDIFISFSHLDDLSIHQDEPGWITRLHRTLEIRMGQLTGKPVKVWRDPKSDQLDDFDPEVGKRLRNARAFVPVLSPPFVRAEGCREEVRSFCRGAHETGEFELNGRPRIFKVVKTPVDQNQFEPDLRNVFDNLMAFDFFEQDQGGHLVEFDESFGEDSRRRFLHRVYDLAHEISATFEPTSGDGGTTSGVLPSGKKRTIYLAETTAELTDKRDQVRREFLERGYRVLPEHPLPKDSAALLEQVQSAMAESDLALHLLGTQYGRVPEGSEQSVAEIQCRAEASDARAIPRIIWAPASDDFEDARQRAFVRQVEQGEMGYRQVEFLRGSIEQLKRLAIKTLDKQGTVGARSSALISGGESEPLFDDSGEKVVYIVCEADDEQAVEPLEDYLYEQGFEVKVPPFDGDPASFTMVHHEQLTLCDAVLVYYGSASAQWAEMKLMDVRKAPGLGRRTPFLAQGVYIAPPTTRRKERFRSRAAIVMQATDNDFDPAALDPFIKRIQENSKR